MESLLSPIPKWYLTGFNRLKPVALLARTGATIAGKTQISRTDLFIAGVAVMTSFVFWLSYIVLVWYFKQAQFSA
jgi:hypothetical protein